MRRRPAPSVLGMSFLDLISCAFGAVVLLALTAAALSGQDGEEGELRVFTLEVTRGSGSLAMSLLIDGQAWPVARGRALPSGVQIMPAVVAGESTYTIFVRDDALDATDTLCIFIHEFGAAVGDVVVAPARHGRGEAKLLPDIALTVAEPSVAIGMEPFMKRPGPCA